jgi:hypothetical protein
MFTFTDTTTPTTLTTLTTPTTQILSDPFGNKVNYTGQMTNGLADGYGIGHFFEYNPPFVYTGYWNQGQLNGSGEAVWDDGSSYSGMYKDGFKNGKGTFKWSDGSVYEGNLKYFDLGF